MVSEAIAASLIAGAEARLASIYVKLKWPFGVDYMLLRGFDAERRPIEEWIRN